MNPSGWSVIRDEADWVAYRTNYEVARGWASSAVADTVWPSRPASYPCLASTHSPSMYKVVTAYVYVTQATQLLMAAGMDVTRNPAFASEAERRQVTGDTGEIVDVDGGRPPAVATGRRPSRSQANFNRYVQANLLALWRTMRPPLDTSSEEFTRVNSVSAEEAQDLVIEALSDVDRWAAADAQQRAKMDGNDLLEKLDADGTE